MRHLGGVPDSFGMEHLMDMLRLWIQRDISDDISDETIQLRRSRRMLDFQPSFSRMDTSHVDFHISDRGHVDDLQRFHRIPIPVCHPDVYIVCLSKLKTVGHSLGSFGTLIWVVRCLWLTHVQLRIDIYAETQGLGIDKG